MLVNLQDSGAKEIDFSVKIQPLKAASLSMITTGKSDELMRRRINGAWKGLNGNDGRRKHKTDD